MRLSIVTFSETGGILQYAHYLSNLMRKYVDQVTIFRPENSTRYPVDSGVCTESIPISSFSSMRTLKYFQLAKRKTYENLVKRLKDFDCVYFANYSPHLFYFADSIQAKIIIGLHDPVRHLERLGHLGKFKVWFDEFAFRSRILRRYPVQVFSKQAINDCAELYGKREDVFYSPLPCHLHDTGLSTDEKRELDTISARSQNLLHLCLPGRIEPYKGIEDFLKAFEKQESSLIKKIFVSIVGDGYVSNEMNKLILKINTKANANHVNLYKYFVSDGFMKELISSCDYVVLPYLEATQSGIIPCAQKLGVPVLTTRVGYLLDQYLDGETGMSFKSSYDLDFEQIIELDRGEMSKKACKYYESKYSDEALGSAFKQILEYVLSKPLL